MYPFKQYIVRSMRHDDLKLVLEWRNSEHIRVNMYSEDIISWENHCAWFTRIQNDLTCKYYIIEYLDQPIGVINFTEINRIHSKCNWGFYIGDKNAPRGSGTVLGLLGLIEVFEHLNIRKVCAEVFGFNQASLRLHEKLGFVQEGYLSRHVRKQDTYEDIVLFACFSEDWFVKKEKLLNLIEKRIYSS